MLIVDLEDGVHPVAKEVYQEEKLCAYQEVEGKC